MMHTRRADMVHRAAEKIFYKRTLDTLPIPAGFLFLGMSHGVHARLSGPGFWYSGGHEHCHLWRIAGISGSFHAHRPFTPLQTLLTALRVQARHLFSSIAMLEKYRGAGKKEGPFPLCAVQRNLFRQPHGHPAQRREPGLVCLLCDASEPALPGLRRDDRRRAWLHCAL